ncbi:MAG: helix-turn-helix transcriptional regulator [Firmicutes bacterium]|jgi:transcriptional regulator with XRE-family HTH domain|nr:helix-turn-helix transcriptional regulator [Bacillota bacterium]
MTLGEKIKHHRTMKGLTQKQLGEMTGIHEVSIRKYEANKIAAKREQLEKIADVLGVPLNEFLELKIVTDSDVLPLLFAIDNEFEIEITSDDNKTFKMEFKDPMLNHFLRDWQSIKQLAELGRVSSEDYELWKNMRSSYTKAYTED